MSNPPRPPQQSYGCPNPACDHYLRRRTVTLTHLGQGLYHRGDVVCECGTPALLVYPQQIPFTVVEDPAP